MLALGILVSMFSIKALTIINNAKETINFSDFKGDMQQGSFNSKLVKSIKLPML